MPKRSAVFVGDTPLIRLRVKDEGLAFNLSAATVLQVKLKAPNVATVTKTGALGASTNFLEYQTVAGDLNVHGDWTVQGYIEKPGWKGHTTKFMLQVEDPI